MSSPESNIPCTITRPWAIYRPPVYRYLKPEHVEEFFARGSLHLSSFAAFQKHNDDERQDSEEGKNHLIFQNRDAGLGVGTITSHGEDAYVLCTCMQLDPERRSRWGGSYIQINNMTAFASAISAHIPGFKGGLEGSCVYQERRILTGDSGNLTQADVMKEGKVDLGKTITISQSLAGPDVFFTKLRKHAADQEYRFLWFSTRPCQ
jgi:hypothetical protein